MSQNDVQTDMRRAQAMPVSNERLDLMANHPARVMQSAAPMSLKSGELRSMAEELRSSRAALAASPAKEVATLRDKVAVLEAALKPFADLGEVVLSEAPAGAVAAWSFAGSAGPHLITLDAFRTARAALNTWEPKQ